MYKYAKLLTYINFMIWSLVVFNEFFNLIKAQDIIIITYILVMGTMIIPLLLYKCKNCGVRVCYVQKSGKWWKPHERFRICPSCGKNPTKIELG